MQETHRRAGASAASCEPTGGLKPNDLGLFDMYGNLYSWCQEDRQPYPQGEDERAIDDEERDLTIRPTARRVLRGGSFDNETRALRSAYRDGGVPSLSRLYVGFRLARTIR